MVEINYPTITDPLSILTVFNNYLDGMGFTYVLIAIWLILIIKLKDGMRKIASASLICGSLSVIFYLLGLVNPALIGAFLLLFVIGVFL